VCFFVEKMSDEITEFLENISDLTEAEKQSLQNNEDVQSSGHAYHEKYDDDTESEENETEDEDEESDGKGKYYASAKLSDAEMNQKVAEVQSILSEASISKETQSSSKLNDASMDQKVAEVRALLSASSDPRDSEETFSAAELQSFQSSGTTDINVEALLKRASKTVEDAKASARFSDNPTERRFMELMRTTPMEELNRGLKAAARLGSDVVPQRRQKNEGARQVSEIRGARVQQKTPAISPMAFAR
jgi:hypothetical protein